MGRMNTDETAVEWERALEILRGRICALPVRELAVDAAAGCVLAEDVVAGISQPPFPRSPYDGYALRAEDVAEASGKAPARLRVVGKSFAGAPYGAALSAGEAVRIMTGGCIPEGADCVVRQEETDEGETVVSVYARLAPFANYCPVGEDFAKGDVLAKRGTTVTAAVAALAASTGAAVLRCVPLPQVAVLSTGDELALPGATLRPGQVHDSNRVYLQTRLKELGLCAKNAGHAADRLQELEAQIAKGLQAADMLITTGGVSVGQRDLVPEALERLGAEVLFRGVKIKPGMPAMGALLDGKSILALSGNPFAAAVDFELLVRPALALLANRPALAPKARPAKLEKAFEKKAGPRRFLKARMEGGRVAIPDEQGNGQMRAMANCNCLAEIPAESPGLAKGAQVNVYPFSAHDAKAGE